MIARLIISPSLNNRVAEINKILSLERLTSSHPDLLYFPDDSKLGIAEARKIKDFFSIKPYSAKGRTVVLEEASNLTTEAQNALLKTLEELPKQGLFILCSSSDARFLPTVLSRCQIIRIKSERSENQQISEPDLEKLLDSTIEERFEYVEKLKDKEEFFYSLLAYFHNELPANSEFTKELLQAEEWIKQNVNIRAILEYLMLVMPQKS